jgi:hypothetical protein
MCRNREQAVRWTHVLLTGLLTGLIAGAFAIDAQAGIRIKGDLWVTIDWKHSRLTVASQRHDFVVFLPYSDSWRLTSGERTLLDGSNTEYSVTAIHRPVSDEDPRELLEDSLDELLVGGARVRFLQFLERDDRSVLCLQVRHAETGPWHWFYWVLIPSGDEWLQLTVLRVAPGDLEPLDTEVVDLLARSSRLAPLMQSAFGAGDPSAID